MKQLKVLDLFSGTQSIAREFRKRGHLTYTVELDKNHEGIDWYENIMNITAKDIIERFGHPDVIWASPPCFTGDTLVLTDKEFKKIKEIQIGDKVITHRCKYETVTNIGRKLVDSIRIIKPSCSTEIETTDNHPFYARTKKRIWNNSKRGWDKIYGEPQWINAKDLTKYHMIGIAINKESKLPEWSGIEKTIKNQIIKKCYNEDNLSNYFENKNFWWLIGRYIGDGWVRNSKTRNDFIICCAKNELNEITSVLDNLKLIDNFFNYGVIEERTTYKIHIYKKELVTYVEQFGKYAYGKKLTSDIFDLPKHLLQSFLEGYFSADGYLKENNNITKWTCSTVSKELAYGIGQCIVKAYNKPMSITIFKKEGIDIIEGRNVNVKDIYMVHYYINSKKCYSFIEDGILWTNIKEIETINKTDYVYNLTVEKDNSYTANGVIVHNCEKFSVASIGRYWEKGSNVPATEESKKALQLLEHTVNLIKELNPTYYFIENPRGKMRKMDCMQDLPRYTVTYCQYGDTRMKPTDLWTNHPNPNFKPPCKNGDSCHVSAPRGSRTGTQGLKGAKERSIIPSQLCEYIAKISEQGFNDIVDLEYIVNKLIDISINSTSEGNWIFNIEGIEKMFGIKLTKDSIDKIEELLSLREEVADVQIYDGEIDIMLYLYCLGDDIKE